MLMEYSRNDGEVSFALGLEYRHYVSIFVYYVTCRRWRRAEPWQHKATVSVKPLYRPC